MNQLQETLRAIQTTINETRKQCQKATNKKYYKHKIAILRAEEQLILQQIGDQYP